MTDDELIRLPNIQTKYAAFRAAVEWGIANGLVRRPGLYKKPEENIQKRRELMARAQEIRLAKGSQ